MKTIFKNTVSNDEKTIFDLYINAEGKVQSDGKRGAKFLEKYADLIVEVAKSEDGSSIFETIGDWVVLSGSKKRGKKPTNDATNDTTNDATNDTTNDTTNDATNDTTNDATNDATNDTTNDVPKKTRRTKKAKANATTTTDNAEVVEIKAVESSPTLDAALSLVSAIQAIKSNNVDENKVRSIVADEIAKFAKAATDEERSAFVRLATVNDENDEIHCENFDEIKADLQDGFYPYLVGAAGCGKSVTAEQLARALGLDFYPMQQVIFGHQVEGYGDAAGNYVPTPVYNAYAHGGLLFFDEWDGSAPEAAIIVNNMLANGEFSFPVVGRVKAHPKFRCIFAGNTVGKGADEEYTGRSVLDGSTRDRLIEYQMSYDRRVEMRIANDDAELVDFMEDIRNAVKKTGIQHIVSYRATKYCEARKDKKATALRRGALKFLEADEIRMLYQALDNMSNTWAQAMYELL